MKARRETKDLTPRQASLLMFMSRRPGLSSSASYLGNWAWNSRGVRKPQHYCLPATNALRFFHKRGWVHLYVDPTANVWQITSKGVEFASKLRAERGEEPRAP